jgi:hypothetical protein
MARQPRQPESEDQHSEKETARRRDEWLRRSLNSPPKPHKDVVAERKEKQSRKKHQGR